MQKMIIYDRFDKQKHNCCKKNCCRTKNKKIVQPEVLDNTTDPLKLYRRIINKKSKEIKESCNECIDKLIFLCNEHKDFIQNNKEGSLNPEDNKEFFSNSRVFSSPINEIKKILIAEDESNNLIMNLKLKNDNSDLQGKLEKAMNDISSNHFPSINEFFLKYPFDNNIINEIKSPDFLNLNNDLCINPDDFNKKNNNIIHEIKSPDFLNLNNDLCINQDENNTYPIIAPKTNNKNPYIYPQHIYHQNPCSIIFNNYKK